MLDCRERVRRGRLGVREEIKLDLRLGPGGARHGRRGAREGFPASWAACHASPPALDACCTSADLPHAAGARGLQPSRAVCANAHAGAYGRPRGHARAGGGPADSRPTQPNPDADAQTKGAYSLGFADVINGTLQIVPAGVAACAGGRGVNVLTSDRVTDMGGGAPPLDTSKMPPEQAAGRTRDIGPACDIYALGAILYEMLTGQRPYPGDTVISVAIQHVNEPVPDVLKVRPELPAEVDTVIKTAMAKEKQKRYPAALDLALALNKAAFGEDRTIPNMSTVIGRQNAPTSSSKRTGWLVAALVLLAAAGGWLGLRGQSPFSLAAGSTSTATVTVVPPTAQPTMTASLVPTAIPTVTVTAAQDTPLVPAIPGGADKVAFVGGNQIYVMNVDGSDLIQIRTDNSAKSGLHWIADGRLVYLSRNCAYIVDVQIERPEQIVCFNANESL